MVRWARSRSARVTLVALVIALGVALVIAMVLTGGSPSTTPQAKNTLPTQSPSPTASPVVVTGTSTKVSVLGTAPGIAPGRSLNFVSQVYSLGPTGPLGSTATITVQLDNALPSGTPLVAATREAASDSWTFLPATLAADGQHASFRTDHLSDVGVMSIDLGQVFSDFKASVAPALVSGVNASVTRPTCQGTTAALQDGYTVGTSASPADATTIVAAAEAAAAAQAAAQAANHPAPTPTPTATPPAPRRKTLFWCLGRSGNTRTVTIVNRRPFAVQVARGNAVPTSINAPVSGVWASWLGVLGSGSQDTFLPPGGSATYSADLQPKTLLTLTAGNDATAQSLRMLYAAVSALDVQVQRFGVADPQPLDTFNTLLARPGCAGSLGQGGAAMLAGCFSPRMVLRTYGTNGRLLLPLFATSGMRPFFANRFSFLADQDVSSDTQTVYVGRAMPDFGALVGSWTGHTRTLSISATGLVVEKIADGCCHRIINLTYQLSQPQASHGTTTATATLTRVVVFNRKALGSPPPKVGATGTISLTKGVVNAPFIGTNFCGPVAAKNGACGA